MKSLTQVPVHQIHFKQPFINYKKNTSMKKTMFFLAILFTVGLTPVKANDWPGPNDRAVETFNKEFKGAEDLRWKKEAEFQKALFFFHGHRLIAYFSEEGRLLGSARDVLFNDLPLPVIKAFEGHFAGADYRMIHEIINEEGTTYWLTLEVKGRQYHVKASTSGSLLEVQNLKNELTKD